MIPPREAGLIIIAVGAVLFTAAAPAAILIRFKYDDIEAGRTCLWVLMSVGVSLCAIGANSFCGVTRSRAGVRA